MILIRLLIFKFAEFANFFTKTKFIKESMIYLLKNL